MELMFLGIGIVIGVLWRHLYQRFHSIYGVLRIDESKSEKDIYRLEIEDLDSLRKKKQVVLEVKNCDHILKEL